MEPYEAFASRLRNLCRTRGSVSATARLLNINRQQFAKYLSGSTLPSAPTLRKICQFFNVAESDLLNGPKRPEPERPSLPRGLEPVVKLFEETKRNTIVVQQELKPGLYFNYFAVGGDPGLLLRALTEVKVSHGILTFRRFNRVLNPQSAGVVALGKHHGYVIPSQHEFAFIGQNQLAPRQLSHLVLERAEVMSGVRFGLALTRSTASSIAVRTALETIDSAISRKQALKRLGLLRVSDRSIPASIATAINPPLGLEGTLNVPRVDLLTNAYN